MRSLSVLIFSLSIIACGDGDRRPENQSSNPLYPSGPEQVQRGQIVTVEGSSVSEAEVVIIDAERLVVLARTPVDDQGGFVVSVPQRPNYWLGVSGPYMATYIDTVFAFTGEAIAVDEPSRSYAAGKAAQVVGVLGDVNNDNQVDIADALLVLLYTLERVSFVAPNQGNIALGDVNEDGQINIADVLLIMTYIANPLDPTLPDGIGLASDRDRAVLITLYEATGGANWDENTNWLISTYSLDQWDGVYTDDEGRVTGLDLDWNRLTGPIPEALGNLNNLKSLSLRGNQLTGTIPEALGQLDSLQTLDLSNNQLAGPISEALLGQLDSLQTLDLSNNQLTGPIPEALGNLNNLESLSLRGNQLTGTIPEALGQLDSLYNLRLSQNELTGPIPSALSQLDNLNTLSLRGNQLTGCIPLALYAIPNNDLHDLGLYSCHILVEDPPVVALYESTPEQLMDKLAQAMRNRDKALYETLLDEDFQFAEFDCIGYIVFYNDLETELTIIVGSRDGSSKGLFDIFIEFHYDFELIRRLRELGAEFPETFEGDPSGHPNEDWEIFYGRVQMLMLDEKGDGYRVDQPMTFKLRQDEEGAWRMVRWLDDPLNGSCVGAGKILVEASTWGQIKSTIFPIGSS